jgi:TATA-box binding protein (TBP) (component of TFIID and TFIIIB)
MSGEMELRLGVPSGNMGKMVNISGGKLQTENVVNVCHTDRFTPEEQKMCREENRGRFPKQEIARFQDTPGAYLVFLTGKIVNVGAKRPAKIHRGQQLLRLYLSRKSKHGRLRIRDFSVKNIVASGRFKTPPKLDWLMDKYPESVKFVRALFPGARCIIPRGEGKRHFSVNIFDKGGFIMAGQKTIQDLEECLPLLEKFANTEAIDTFATLDDAEIDTYIASIES